jgi:hypothetical protein
MADAYTFTCLYVANTSFFVCIIHVGNRFITMMKNLPHLLLCVFVAVCLVEGFTSDTSTTDLTVRDLDHTGLERRGGGTGELFGGFIGLVGGVLLSGGNPFVIAIGLAGFVNMVLKLTCDEYSCNQFRSQDGFINKSDVPLSIAEGLAKDPLLTVSDVVTNTDGLSSILVSTNSDFGHEHLQTNLTYHADSNNVTFSTTVLANHLNARHRGPCLYQVHGVKQKRLWY